VYTATTPELDLSPLLELAEGVRVVRRPAPADTGFCNCYDGGRRQQLLFSRATPLVPEGVPPAWKQAPLVLLGPVAQEVSPSWAQQFPRAIVAACLQGWLRAWDEEQRVHFTPWEEAESWLSLLAAAFLSEEDIQGEGALAEQYAARCPLLVLTQGARGATLYRQGQACPVAPFPVQEVEPTGAGDVFAAAFLVRYAEGASALEAARFASATAALSVRGEGPWAIPDRPAVEACLRMND
jgi:sugar/nucleoside kinase (ribokinase family)